MSPGESTDGNQQAAGPEVTAAHSACAELAERARHQLATHGQFRRLIDAFTFEVLGDTLVVHGSVPSFYLKQLVQTVLRDLDGVRQVDNQVDVIGGIGQNW